jgi:hypothetical protein
VRPLPPPRPLRMQAVEAQRASFGAKVVRHVPVEWVGCANEVVLMGDWDGWTRGQELSAEDVTVDSVYARFEGTVVLRPGRYLVKLMVGALEGLWGGPWLGLRAGAGPLHRLRLPAGVGGGLERPRRLRGVKLRRLPGGGARRQGHALTPDTPTQAR